MISINPFYLPRFKQKTERQPKGQPCPNCGLISQFRKVNANWVKSDNTIILNNIYQVLVCQNCGHRIYPEEMLREYTELKKAKVLV